MTMEVQVGAIQLQAEESQGPRAPARSLERGAGWSSLTSRGEASPSKASVWDVWPSKRHENILPFVLSHRVCGNL